MKSDILTLFYLLPLVLLFAILFILIIKKARTRSIIVTAIVGIIIISLALPTYYIISFQMANGSKSFKTDDTLQVEKKLRDEFGDLSMDVEINRGWSSNILIESKQKLSDETYIAIQKRVESLLNEGLSDKIIQYCEKKYNSDFVPQKDRFSLIIEFNKEHAYNSALSLS